MALVTLNIKICIRDSLGYICIICIIDYVHVSVYIYVYIDIYINLYADMNSLIFWKIEADLNDPHLLQKYCDKCQSY